MRIWEIKDRVSKGSEFKAKCEQRGASKRERASRVEELCVLSARASSGSVREEFSSPRRRNCTHRRDIGRKRSWPWTWAARAGSFAGLVARLVVWGPPRRGWSREIGAHYSIGASWPPRERTRHSSNLVDSTMMMMLLLLLMMRMILLLMMMMILLLLLTAPALHTRPTPLVLSESRAALRPLPERSRVAARGALTGTVWSTQRPLLLPLPMSASCQRGTWRDESDELHVRAPCACAEHSSSRVSRRTARTDSPRARARVDASSVASRISSRTARIYKPGTFPQIITPI